MTSNNIDLYVKIAYFTSLAGASILFGFGLTLNKHRKDTSVKPEAVLYNEGAALARKALMKGTIYAVSGFGIFALASYQLFGKKMIKDFKAKAIKDH